jgi:hypothetical protein
MSGSLRSLIVTAALTGILGIGTASAEAPLQLAPQKGVLLLRSGQVQLGKITPAGDHYIVSVPHGEFRFRTSDVELLCNDLEEVYEHKRAQLELGKVADHVDLADWCLRNQLLDHADKELGYALAADPTYPRIRLLERRLKLARRERKPAPVSHKVVEQGPTNDDLDRFVRGMPASAVEAFTSTIQPLLVNTCTTSGCHGPQSDAKLKLLRIPPGSPPTLRTTQRNLYATWQQINPGDPAASPLLVVPVQQHGTTKAAMFTDHDAAQYRQLVAWVGQISRGRKVSQPPTVNAPTTPLLQTMPPSAPARQASEFNKLGSHDPQARLARKPAHPADAAAAEMLEGAVEISAAEQPADDGGKREPAVKRERKARIADYVPVDPFDPEIFNRQYHSDE